MNEVIFTLRNKLSLSNYPKERNDFFEYFKGIANLLMNKCVISRGIANYEILEIEFYLFTPNHQDIITYPRNTKAGHWFFHQSGVDLTFESDEGNFGGILIRGIREVRSGKQVFGPQNCVNLLWDKFDAFDINPSEYPIITSCEHDSDAKIISRPRYIKTKADKIKEWSDRVIKNGFTLNTTEEARANLVFNSSYRFIKTGAINKNDEAWKKYTAKPDDDQNSVC